MTVHAFPPPTADLPGPAAGVVAPAIGEVRARLGAVTRVPAGVVPDDELAAAIEQLAVVEAQAAAARLALSAEAERRRLAEQDAATGTDAWLSQLTGNSREVERGGLWLAEKLEMKYAATREAFAAGRLRIPQVRVIVEAAERIPGWATADQVRTAEEWLVGKATGDINRNGRPIHARRLRQVARRMCRVVSHELAEAHESAMLNRERNRAEHETWMWLQDNGDGTFRGRFVIPELQGNLLRTWLERLTSPRRLGRDLAGNPVEDPTLPGNGQQLSRDEHLGTAFCELIEHLPKEYAGRSDLTVLVRIELEALLTGAGGASLDGGVRISAGDARRLACNAGLVPAVFGTASVPLDLGREARLHDRYQRLALGAVHETCAAAGCERPFAWCEIHHPHAWSRGGRTDLDNAVPLCWFHHRRAHDKRFDLRRTPAGDWRFHRRR